MGFENSFPRVPSKKTEEQELEENKNLKKFREERLEKYGIKLLSREEMAKMSLSEVMNYQTEMKDKIRDVQRSFSKDEEINNRVIFDDALRKVDIVKNGNDFISLRKEFGLDI
jgi:hypothetical protein